MITLAISNQKGGVAKTTLSFHLAEMASDQGLKTLLIDFDTQENASMMYPPSPDDNETYVGTTSLFDEVRSKLPIESVKDNLSIIRSNKASLTAISETKGVEGFEARPMNYLKKIRDDYDICIIDTPPSRNLLLFSALLISDKVLTPVKLGLFELSGFADLLSDIARIRKSGLNKKLKHIGSIAVRVNTRSRNQMKQLEDFKKTYKTNVLDISLAEREAVQTAINNGKPVWESIKGSSHRKTANEWRDVCRKILKIVMEG